MTPQDIIITGNASIEAAKRNKLHDCAYSLTRAVRTVELCLKYNDQENLDFAVGVLQTEIEDFENRRTR
jgi:hypothetical protein